MTTETNPRRNQSKVLLMQQHTASRRLPLGTLLENGALSHHSVVLGTNIEPNGVAHREPLKRRNSLQPALLGLGKENLELKNTVGHAMRVQGRYPQSQDESLLLVARSVTLASDFVIVTELDLNALDVPLVFPSSFQHAASTHNQVLDIVGLRSDHPTRCQNRDVASVGEHEALSGLKSQRHEKPSSRLETVLDQKDDVQYLALGSLHDGLVQLHLSISKMESLRKTAYVQHPVEAGTERKADSFAVQVRKRLEDFLAEILKFFEKVVVDLDRDIELLASFFAFLPALNLVLLLDALFFRKALELLIRNKESSIVSAQLSSTLLKSV